MGFTIEAGGAYEATITASDVVDGKLEVVFELARRGTKATHLADMPVPPATGGLVGVASVRINGMELILCQHCVEPMITAGCHGICESCGFQYGCGD